MAQIRADEISKVLLSEIENFDAVANVSETGSVISVGDGIARVYGLQNVMAGELVDFDGGAAHRGVTLTLAHVSSCSATSVLSPKAVKSSGPGALCRSRLATP